MPTDERFVVEVRGDSGERLAVTYRLEVRD